MQTGALRLGSIEVDTGLNLFDTGIPYKRANVLELSKQVTAKILETDMIVWQRHAQKTKMIHKRSNTFDKSVRKLLEGLN